jgi:hypothetical protein
MFFSRKKAMVQTEKRHFFHQKDPKFRKKPAKTIYNIENQQNKQNAEHPTSEST